MNKSIIVDVKKIKRLYLSGVKANDIAKELGVSRGVIYDRLRKIGIGLHAGTSLNIKSNTRLRCLY